MRKGFTLIEMLVVIGIIIVLLGASIAGFSKMVKTAERSKAQELVSNAATALTAYFQKEGSWPKSIVNARQADGNGQLLDEKAAWPLAKGKYLSLTIENNKLSGADRFGVVSPWAMAAIKKADKSSSAQSIKIGTKTVQDHILHFAVDLDGDGITIIKDGAGGTIKVRATACVWCCDKDGYIGSINQAGRAGKRGIFSFSAGQIAD